MSRDAHEIVPDPWPKAPNRTHTGGGFSSRAAPGGADFVLLPLPWRPSMQVIQYCGEASLSRRWSLMEVGAAFWVGVREVAKAAQTAEVAIRKPPQKVDRSGVAPMEASVSRSTMMSMTAGLPQLGSPIERCLPSSGPA